MAGKDSGDSYARGLQEAVEKARKNREWRYVYRTLLMNDQEFNR